MTHTQGGPQDPGWHRAGAEPRGMRLRCPTLGVQVFCAGELALDCVPNEFLAQGPWTVLLYGAKVCRWMESRWQSPVWRTEGQVCTLARSAPLAVPGCYCTAALGLTLPLCDSRVPGTAGCCPSCPQCHQRSWSNCSPTGRGSSHPGVGSVDSAWVTRTLGAGPSATGGGIGVGTAGGAVSWPPAPAG